MILERIFVHEGMSARGAVVVAHPDDESLWFGGLMIAWPIQWQVICCSIPEADPIRAWKFHDACAQLGATGRVMPMVEAPPYAPVRASAIRLLQETIVKEKFDVIVTHGVIGEYRHKQHAHLHEEVMKAAPEITMCGCYGAEQEGPFVVDLDDNQWERKRQALMAYDHYAPADGAFTKGQALIRAYGDKFNLRRETYVGPE